MSDSSKYEANSQATSLKKGTFADNNAHFCSIPPNGLPSQPVDTKQTHHKPIFLALAKHYAFYCQEAIQRLGLAGGLQCFKEQHLIPPKGATEHSTLARMVDADVWERKLRKQSQQRHEKRIRDAGQIYRQGQPYCSNWHVSDFVEAQKDSQAYLSRQRVLSSAGDELSLLDIAKATVANPYNRRAEMMVRMRGIEEVAKSAGMICLFVNPTASSKYHCKRLVKAYDAQGQRHPAKDYFIANPRYQARIEVCDQAGQTRSIPNTPQLSHAFIKRIVSRSIAKFKRQHIAYIGYKVVEPHHDGTVHWHMAFFIQPEHKQLVSDIFIHYGLKEDGEEKGAAQHRVLIKDHDPKLGSVTGYMAKYISKGIAGFGIGEDSETGLDCDDAVTRILAWKSLWSIRQFAFYGSPSVTVWRELRRLREPVKNPIVEQARLAADSGQWDQFIHLMKKHPMSLFKSPVINTDGQEKKNKYGEHIQRIAGLKIQGLSGWEILRTRFKEWFLVDLDQLKQRLVRGLPFASRHDEYYLQWINDMIEQAVTENKVLRLHQGTGGVVPAASVFFSPLSAIPPLGLVRNNVTVSEESKK